MRAFRACWLALLCAACGGGDRLPMPDLSEVEPLVREKVERTRRAALDDPTAENLARYARTLHAHGMAVQAEPVYLMAAEVGDPETAAGCLHLAGACISSLFTERAIEHFQAALALRPDNEATLVRLAIAAEQLGCDELARESYRKALALSPSSHAHLGLGRLRLLEGDARGAIQELEKARELDPTHRQVYEALARAYARVGDAEASRQAAQKAGDLSSAHPFDDPLLRQVNAEEVTYRAFESRALALLDAERARAMSTGRRDPALLEKALEAIDSARRARPDYAPARHYRGLILAGLGRVDEAITELEAVVRARPGDSNARLTLAGMLRAGRRPFDALEQLDALLEREPRNVDALTQRAALRIEMGESEAAQGDLRAILEIDPENAWARARVRD